jgi:hypothetical protein
VGSGARSNVMNACGTEGVDGRNREEDAYDPYRPFVSCGTNHSSLGSLMLGLVVHSLL